MKSNEFLDEGINDKGKFKVVFMGGLPGSGKSTVIKQVTDSQVGPKVVNVDKQFEHLANKHDKDVSSADAWKQFKDPIEVTSKKELFLYINSMLPMFIDGTASRTSSLTRRASIMSTLGYDVFFIWVDITPEESIERIQGRKRKVDTDFIKQLSKKIESNKKFYKQYFRSNYYEVSNSGNNFNAVANEASSKASQFFNSPIINLTGNKIIETLTDSNEKYLVPNIYTQEQIVNAVNEWY